MKTWCRTNRPIKVDRKLKYYLILNLMGLCDLALVLTLKSQVWLPCMISVGNLKSPSSDGYLTPVRESKEGWAEKLIEIKPNIPSHGEVTEKVSSTSSN